MSSLDLAELSSNSLIYLEFIFIQNISSKSLSNVRLTLL